MKSSVLLLVFVLVLLSGCSPTGHPTERGLYQVASKAVLAHSEFPKGGVLTPAEDASFFVAKNAACVVVPYEYADESGKKIKASYTVWLKNMAHSWQIDRCRPTPAYTSSPAATNEPPAE